MKKTVTPRGKKLSLHKNTLKALTVRTAVKAGVRTCFQNGSCP